MVHEIEKNIAGNVCKILVGNKVYMDNKCQVSYDEGKSLADSLGMKFLETSAKISSNVVQTFQSLVSDIKSKQVKNNIISNNNLFNKPHHLSNIKPINNNKQVCNCWIYIYVLNYLEYQ